MPNPRHLFIIAVAEAQPVGLTMSYAVLNQLLANSPFGAYGNHKALGAAISASWRLAKQLFGQDVADKIADTFVGADGEPPWKKP